MKVALYVRVSTDKQEAQNQEGELRQYCLSQGYDIYKVYSDVISGAKDKRPGFDLMFQEAREGKFNLILFWDISRFSRAGTLFTLQKLKELEGLNISWHSFKEPYFSSIGPFKDVVISIMATLSKIEREQISQRTKAGMKGKVNVGKRGPDKKPRLARNDRGKSRIKKGGNKNPQTKYINAVIG
jgi:DNA invertase Pin-like site-specific DNA recombinase